MLIEQFYETLNLSFHLSVCSS